MATRQIELPHISNKYKWEWDVIQGSDEIQFKLYLYRLYRIFPSKIALARRLVEGEWFSIPAAADEATQTAIIHMNCDIIRLQTTTRG